jgi:drug/metabolite transporter (DMT)-like permease
MRRLLILGFIWGWSFLFIKVAVEGLTPTTVAWARIGLGAIVLHLVLRREGLRLPTDGLMVRHFGLVAFFGAVLPFTLLAWGEERITSALTSVLNASTPMFTAAIAVLAGQERLRRMQVGGLAIGIAGIAVAAGFGASDLSGSSVTGTVAALGAGACYGVAAVYVRRNLGGVSPIVAAAGQLTMGSLLLAPVAVATSALHGVELAPNRVGAVLLLGALGTGLAFVLYYRIIADLGPTKATLVTYIVPLVAVVAGIVVLDEPFEWRLVVGGVLTVAGIAGVTAPPGALALRWRRRQPSGAPTTAGVPDRLTPATADDAVG